MSKYILMVIICVCLIGIIGCSYTLIPTGHISRHFYAYAGVEAGAQTNNDPIPTNTPIPTVLPDITNHAYNVSAGLIVNGSTNGT